MKVVFRVDASSQIGTGHFIRCLTLANALKQRGVQIRFVSRQLPEYLRDMLAAKGHGLALLNSAKNDAEADELAHAHWLGVSQAQDAADSIQALSNVDCDWLIVDHYALNFRWESALRQSAGKILVIDDIADRQHDCDVLLDQNLYADMNSRYSGKVPAHCQLLLGPRYALLREEFRQLRDKIGPRDGPVKRVLVFFGGVDADNYTGRAIEALSEICITDLHVDVVIGAQHPYREQIEVACIQHGFICHVQTSRMAELAAAADLAIGAGGSASWERCCLGLPALLVALADNQINIAKALDWFGACIYVGTSKTVSAPTMRNAIVSLLSTQNQLRVLSEKSYSLVDGLGVDRICQEMSCKMKISILCTDPDHPVIKSLQAWMDDMSSKGYSAALVFDKAELQGGDILFLVSCGQMIRDAERKKYKVTLVLHASDLPKGRGWSPHIWSILDGANQITVSLLKASEPVDSGAIWLKTKFTLEGHELLPEINAKLFAAELLLMTQAVEQFEAIKPIEQVGDSGAYMPKRSPADSQLDPNKTIAEQFDLLRVIDSQRYPAFFNYRGKRYLIKIEKVENEQ